MTELEKYKVPAGAKRGSPPHRNDGAHRMYSKRAGSSVDQTVEMLSSEGVDVSKVKGQNARAYRQADG